VEFPHAQLTGRTRGLGESTHGGGTGLGYGVTVGSNFM
jgi:hypothetical protein